MKINYLLFWGLFGLITEIFFTALVNLISKKDFNLTGHTSLMDVSNLFIRINLWF